MPKPFDELWDGPAADPSPDAAPAPEAQAQPAAEGTPQQPAEGEQQSRPAPEAQQPAEAKGDKPGSEAGAASQDKGSAAGPDTEPNDGRDPAYGRLRKERNDYREQASQEKIERARLEERLAAIERERAAEQAELQRLRVSGQQSAPQPQPARIPSPAEDPAGYHAAVMQDVQARLWAETCANSERLLKSRVSPAEVDQAIAAFGQESQRNPALAMELRQQLDPARWVYERAQQQKAMAEIGTDPAAYRAKLEADIRAQIEAEMQANQAAQSPSPDSRPAPRPDLPPSLGRTPNAGPRSGPQYTGPTHFSQLWSE